jgi:molybdopterin molybdotransferase
MRSELSFQEALAEILSKVEPGGDIHEVSLSEAINRVPAQDIFASEPYPAFDNSAVDGFALACEEDARVGSVVRVSGTLFAGDDPAEAAPLKPGSALRVLTGSALPPETYAVVMQEDVAFQGNSIRLRKTVPRGKHIRRRGDDFQEGHLLTPRGVPLNAGGIALLASQGIQTVRVFPQPRAGVLTTGEELIPPSEKILPGKVRDTNSLMLEGLLKTTKPEPLVTGIARCRDNPEELGEKITRMSGENDALIISGGASVGDRDYVGDLVAKKGEVIFHKVKIKPGKPFLFGRIGKCLVFGLPGNPASAFVCFFLFVKPALRKMSGVTEPAPAWLWVRLLDPVQTHERDEFVRAHLTLASESPEMPVATVAGEQGSFGLRSLAMGNCLIWLPAHTIHTPGEPCRALLLDL